MGSEQIATTRTNPFVGPRPLQAMDGIHGRRREENELYYLLVAERIAWLHSPSGAGKSSLVQAGLLPRMSQKGFLALPTVRVNRTPDTGGSSRYERSAVDCIDPTAQNLADAIQRAKTANPGASLVLVFDQFEEVLTLDPDDPAEKKAFFVMLGELLQAPDLWVLFVLREEYLAVLHPYVPYLPTRLTHTFRLDLLSRENARLAIRGISGEGKFSPEALDKLVDDLAAGHQGAIDPMHLQVVGRSLWANIDDPNARIELSHLERFGNVSEALGAYYADSLRNVCRGDQPLERDVRIWFESALITAQGVRTQVLHEEAASSLPAELIERLEKTRLIRFEPRGDDRLFLELAHDRLIPAIRENNSAWLKSKQHWVQRRAAEWRQQRPKSLLLLDLELQLAREWAAQQSAWVTELDRAFLRESEDQQASVNRERKKNRTIRYLLYAVSLLFVLVIAAYLQTRAEQRRSFSTEIGLSATALISTDRELALMLARQAFRIKDTTAARDALRTSMQAFRGASFPHTERVRSVAFSPDGTWLATASEDATVRLWDAATGKLERFWDIEGAKVDASSVSFTLDGSHLIAGASNGSVQLINIAQDAVLRVFLAGNADIVNVAFSPDGQTLATAAVDSSVALWDMQGKKLRNFSGQTALPSRIAFHPKIATQFVTAMSDGNVTVWDTRTGQVLRQFEQPADDVRCIAFRPDGQQLAAALGDGSLRIWEAGSGKQLPAIPAYQTPNGTVAAEGVAFDATGRIATVSSQGVVKIWAPQTRALELELRAGASESAFSVAFRPRSTQLVAAGDKVRLYELDFDTLRNQAEKQETRAFTVEECQRYLRGPCPRR